MSATKRLAGDFERRTLVALLAAIPSTSDPVVEEPLTPKDRDHIRTLHRHAVLKRAFWVNQMKPFLDEIDKIDSWGSIKALAEKWDVPPMTIRAILADER